MISTIARSGTVRWQLIWSGSPAIGVAERDAIGTTARLAVWPSSALRRASGAVDRELAELDRAASRFRSDSELSLVHARGGEPSNVGSVLAEAVQVALAAAAWTDGLVDPTIGAALIALGYDRDFAQLRQHPDTDAELPETQVPGWRCLRLTDRRLHVPASVRLDLGATAKGLGADRSAHSAHRASGSGGVLVSLGGDIAAAGGSPLGGWPVLVADDHRQSECCSSGGRPVQVVRLTGGGLATSSIGCRQWTRAGHALHHIVDPRTARPADGPWRTVSVAAATCADANAAATAAIISGAQAEAWLADRGIPARLVGRDGSVRHVGGWPAGDGGRLPLPSTRWLVLPAAGDRP